MATSFPAWPEIERAVAERRCELVLSSIPADQREPPIDDEKLQLYFLNEDSPLNLLELSAMGLKELSAAIGNARHLTNLVLHTNALVQLPDCLGTLTKLKLLDCSRNELTRIPASISSCVFLSTLNLSRNKLTSDSLPDFAPMCGLQSLDLSHNDLDTIPASLFACANSKLQTLMLNSNRIATLSPDIDAMADLLKVLDLNANKLTDLPVELRAMQKLKTLDLTGNGFSDKRFAKLVADKRHTVAAVLDYLRKHAPATKTKKDGNRGETKSGDEENTAEQPGHGDEADKRPVVTVLLGRTLYSMRRCDVVVPIRPHIVCCVVHNIAIDAGMLKKFLTAQITPMQKTTPTDAKSLVAALNAEAELLRKRQKRNTYSSIHKYLHLVKNLALFPCLVDATGLVLSFAPVTNSESTKITPDTTTMFVEVSSNESQQLCRQVMDRVIEEVLNLGLSSELVIDQIKITQENGELCVAYPDRADLRGLEAIANVRRETSKPT